MKRASAERKSRSLGRLAGGALAALGLAVAVGLATVPAPVAAQPPTLAALFDNVGIATPTNAAAGNFDGVGDAYSSTALAADGLSPGATILHDGLSITWPNVPAGTSDNVVADGQTAALSASGNTLGIVASSAYSGASGVSGTFTVNYADGTSTSETVDFADWADNGAGSGTDVLATGSGLGSGLSAPVSLYYGTIPLSPSETVASVTLPTVGSTIGANVSALHVFDLAVGTVGATAAGAPGTLSYYDEARKDCVGTAANAESQVWYTLADGTLSDVYSPTIDNTDVKSLDPIVTGTGSGGAFTALQPRNMSYTVSELGTTGMACRVVALDAANDFAVVSDFVTDPATDSVVMQVSLVPLPGAPNNLAVYLRFNPLLNGHAGGGSNNVGGESATVDNTASNGQIPVAYSTNSFTQALNRTYATPIYSALAASTPFSAVETGYVGEASDGLTELDGSQQLTSTAPNANNGNVVQTVKLSFGAGSATAPTYPTGFSASGATSSCATGASPSSGASAITAAGIAGAVSAASGDTVSAANVQSVTVSLGFGQGETSAVNSAIDSAAVPFATTFNEYQSQWQAYDADLCAPPASAGSVSPTQVAQAWWLSANVIKASEDKTFLGATAASLASPWGQAVPAGNPEGAYGLASYFGSYREVFPRDAYETFTGFLVDGDLTTAQQMVNYWFDDLQLPNGSFPRNGLLNGLAAPDTGGLQLDETADPILAAWQAGMAGNTPLYQNHIKPAADFLVANGPETSGSVERWEEQNGYSPSTMADEVAGLVAAGNIAQAQGDTASARLFFATADDFRNLILETTVVDTPTSNGSLSSSPYFLRVDKTGNPNQAFDYSLGNGNGGSYDQRKVIDQGFVELVRLGELSPTSSLVTNSLAIVGSTIDLSTPSGTGVLRYNGDGYGDCFPFGNTPPDASPANQSCPGLGVPWADQDTGTGHPWPVLSGENGEYQVAAGNAAGATSDLDFMLNSASGVGLVPEQVWDDTNVAASPFASDPTNGTADPAGPANPTSASIGFTDGQAAGSAAPLTWAQAQELRLLADLGSGTIEEQPSIVAQRYQSVAASGTATVAVPLSVTAPLAVSGENVPANMQRPSVTLASNSTTVSGTTAAGATVDVAVTGAPQGSALATTTIVTTTAGSGGAFSVPVSLPNGSSSVEVATTTGAATNEALFSVNNDFVAGTVVLQAPAAPDGGFGPGTYAYPTQPGDFPADSFRLTGLTVINSGTTSTIEVGVANMQNIFGQLAGLQLVDLYIHAPAGQVPNGELQSTGAAGPADSPDPDNYTIASADAWNQLIQVNANTFGTFEWVTPGSTSGGLTGARTVGTPSVSITQLSPQPNGDSPGVFAITLPTAQLGTPGPGWVFTVTLAGQGGSDNGGVAYPRQFTSTPGSYSFGVCAPGGTSPICSLNPSTVPNVMDTIPPPGTSVHSELNPLAGPPALQGVEIQAPTITSANSTTFTAGSPGSFTVQTTGQPTPSLTEAGALPSGVTFTDNGNGTATIAGTPTAGMGGVYYFTITAANGVGSPAIQQFTLTVPVTAAPTGTVASTLSISLPTVSPILGTFAAGVAQTYTTQVGATVTSTAASATLTVADLSGVGIAGHLYNPSGGGYSLPQALQAAGSSSAAGAVGSTLANVSASPLTLVTYGAPVSNDTPTVTFAQPIGATDPLRTGTYSKTLTFTLATSSP